MNRLLADATLPPEKRLTRLNSLFFNPRQGPPSASGLLGPVRLMTAAEPGVQSTSEKK